MPRYKIVSVDASAIASCKELVRRYNASQGLEFSSSSSWNALGVYKVRSLLGMVFESFPGVSLFHHCVMLSPDLHYGLGGVIPLSCLEETSDPVSTLDTFIARMSVDGWRLVSSSDYSTPEAYLWAVMDSPIYFYESKYGVPMYVSRKGSEQDHVHSYGHKLYVDGGGVYMPVDEEEDPSTTLVMVKSLPKNSSGVYYYPAILDKGYETVTDFTFGYVLNTPSGRHCVSLSKDRDGEHIFSSLHRFGFLWSEALGGFSDEVYGSHRNPSAFQANLFPRWHRDVVYCSEMLKKMDSWDAAEKDDPVFVGVNIGRAYSLVRDAYFRDELFYTGEDLSVAPIMDKFIPAGTVVYVVSDHGHYFGLSNACDFSSKGSSAYPPVIYVPVSDLVPSDHYLGITYSCEEYVGVAVSSTPSMVVVGGASYSYAPKYRVEYTHDGGALFASLPEFSSLDYRLSFVSSAVHSVLKDLPAYVIGGKDLDVEQSIVSKMRSFPHDLIFVVEGLPYSMRRVGIAMGYITYNFVPHKGCQGFPSMFYRDGYLDGPITLVSILEAYHRLFGVPPVTAAYKKFLSEVS